MDDTLSGKTEERRTEFFRIGREEGLTDAVIARCWKDMGESIRLYGWDPRRVRYAFRRLPESFPEALRDVHSAPFIWFHRRGPQWVRAIVVIPAWIFWTSVLLNALALATRLNVWLWLSSTQSC